METVDKKQIKAKSFAIKSIMKNEKLRGTMLDSWNAAPGSTKRTRAKSVLKSLNKTGANYGFVSDGMGGGAAATNPFANLFSLDSSGNMTYKPPTDTSGTPTSDLFMTSGLSGIDPNYTGRTKFVSGVSDYIAPQYRLGFDTVPGQGLGDGQAFNQFTGSINNITPSAGEMYSSPKYYGPELKPSDVFKQPSSSGNVTVMGSEESLGLPISPQSYGQPQQAIGPQQQMAGLSGGTMASGDDPVSAAIFSLTSVVNDKGKNGTTMKDWLKGNESLFDKLASLGYKNTDLVNEAYMQTRQNKSAFAKDMMITPREQNVGAGATPPSPENPAGTPDTTTPIITDPNNLAPDTILGPGGDPPFDFPIDMDYLESLFTAGNIATVDDWYDSLDPSLKDYYDDYYEEIKNGGSPRNIINKKLRDVNELAELLGIPQSEIGEIIPYDGVNTWMADQLIGLKDTVRSQFQLDEQLSRLMTLNQQGMTLDVDLKAYIRGRDQYLGQIDKLIDDSGEKIAYMDTSNPYVADRMNNYSKYLGILKGRQTMRYQDFLDTSLAYHQAKIQNHTNLYNQSITDANEMYEKFSLQYEAKAKDTQNTYNELKLMIQDTYTSVQNRVTEMRNIELMERQKAMDALNMFGTIMSLYEREQAYTQNASSFTLNQLSAAEELRQSDLYNNARIASEEAQARYYDAQAAAKWADVDETYAGLNVIPGTEEIDPDTGEIIPGTGTPEPKPIEWKVLSDTNIKTYLNIDENGVMQEFDPIQAMILGQSDERNPESVLTEWYRNGTKSISAFVSSGNFMDYIGNFLPIYDDIMNQLLSNPSDEERAILEDARVQVGKMITNGITGGINTAVTEDPQKEKRIQKLIEDLVGKGIFDEKEEEEDRQQILSRYSDLGDITEIVFDMFIEDNNIFTDSNGINLWDFSGKEFMDKFKFMFSKRVLNLRLPASPTAY